MTHMLIKSFSIFIPISVYDKKSSEVYKNQGMGIRTKMFRTKTLTCEDSKGNSWESSESDGNKGKSRKFKGNHKFMMKCYLCHVAHMLMKSFSICISISVYGMKSVEVDKNQGADSHTKIFRPKTLNVEDIKGNKWKAIYRKGNKRNSGEMK